MFELTPVERIKGLRLPNSLTEDLAYFCGVLAGDGSIGYNIKKKHWWISCVGNPKDEIEFYDNILRPIIKELFNLNVAMRLHNKKTSYGFTISSRSLVKYFTQLIGLPLGKKYDTLKIPPIFSGRNNLIKRFISGVADTDFHLAIKKSNYPVITGVSKSNSFLREIETFLIDLGFTSCIYKRSFYDKRLGKETINYALQISGYKNFLKWIKEIGFKHPKNQSKIAFLLESRNSRG
jgi:hypothetical protein